MSKTSSSNTASIYHKRLKEASLTGSILAGISSASLGIALAFGVSANTPPQKYNPKADPKTGQMAPPPSGIWYWEGPMGTSTALESQFLAAQSTFDLTDSDLNLWSKSTLKPTKPAANTSTPDTKTADGKPAPAPATSEASFAVVPDNPNFHVFHDPKSAAATDFILQVALPIKVTVLGQETPVLYQARGSFIPGAHGPEFVPNYSSFGTARIPPLLAKTVFNALFAAYAKNPDAQKYADQWAKFNSATLQDGRIVLAAAK